jgi:plastocyanin
MTSMRHLLLLAATCMLLSGVMPPATLAADSPTIVMAKDFMFAPTSLTVTAGSTVTWTNRDEEPHTVVSDIGLFRSGAMDTNESFSFKFDKPGTYHYACSIHPRMVGTILVQ